MAKKETMVRIMHGVVTAKSGTKTIKVKVERKHAHPLYGKVVATHKSYLVHADDVESVKIGDLVAIKEVKPMSKNKHWALVIEASK
jgi:small subunit ribosomal protein S17